MKIKVAFLRHYLIANPKLKYKNLIRAILSGFEAES